MRLTGAVKPMVLAALGLTACQAVATQVTPTLVPSPSPTVSPAFSGEEAMRIAEAQMAFGPRPTGSNALRQTGDYILARLAEAGWSIEEQGFEYQGVQARNLIGRAGGDLDGPMYLLGAHYDTRRRADQDAASPAAPVPGANDGASGVAVLLELARVLDVGAVHGDVWLVFFDAEDNGYLDGWDWIAGSRYFAANLAVSPEYVIIVDMVGDAEQELFYEGNSDPHLQSHLWAIAAELGYTAHFVAEQRHTMLDDHIPFVEQGIPSVDIIDFDYPYWHTTEDTLDKLSPDSLERVGRVLEEFLERGGEYPGGH